MFVARVFIMVLIVGGIIFVSAGRWDLPFVWAILATLAGFYLMMPLVVDPALVRERIAPGPGNQDRLTRPASAVLLIAHWILAGLDVGRFHWSPIPWPVQLAGLIGYIAALGVNLWAMRINRFYSSVVRVQEDRGHHVVDGGPYRIVRHPGYAATLFATLAGSAALGSCVAMIPAIGFAALFLRRTCLEDRMLCRDLPDYAAYAQRVRWRLLPGIY